MVTIITFGSSRFFDTIYQLKRDFQCLVNVVMYMFCTNVQPLSAHISELLPCAYVQGVKQSVMSVVYHLEN